ncbi:6-phosphogluconolactonase [Rhodococcus sp. BP-252]|uniref:6-phosphogluconolactonase n=1 Tax=Rhodococcoides kyotonense TaxID=398843 RepID=A0A177YFM5_9NOCA|nr:MULTISPECIES: 6-phosphogluconolactonase [Rhodococcus]MBY6409987.1 6-phosphogluconolactonase [Rhodococcus sp. BP-320]MBY6414956.1 6-phosphogluconolactonase [Rhodococcus sp. BP-321]MBY6421341.1 6-phosphogluconolactonase [Rhodococcus sp. BP-324]MBY6425736.1 6-phosphogluconolactonase [Rhodococcus sp. BP-323]MBY6429852.1 6-phosphogluconolactonase [Rhodococcus sp. BP-322]
MSETSVLHFLDADALVDAARSRFVDVVTSAQAERGSASVVLTGGGTGIALLEALRKDSGNIDWSRVDVYFGDERFLPAGDPERNEVQASDALLNHVDVHPDRVFRMAASDGPHESDPEVAAASYARVLAAHADEGERAPEFDVHLLGMGGEGHINSLFPHTDAVRETTQYVIAVEDSPKPPPVRITLTLPAIRRAKHVWLLVSGEAKAEAVAAAVGGASPDDVPSAGAVGSESTVWFVDTAAASKLDT